MATVISIKKYEPPVETLQVRLQALRGKNQILRNIGTFSQNYTSTDLDTGNLRITEKVSIASQLSEIEAVLIQVNGPVIMEYTSFIRDEPAGDRDSILRFSQLVILEDVKNLEVTPLTDEVDVQYIAVGRL